MKGTIKHVVVDRGFAFVLPAGSTDRREELFFHVRGLDGTLPFDESLLERHVEFDVELAPDGRKRAINVRPAR